MSAMKIYATGERLLGHLLDEAGPIGDRSNDVAIPREGLDEKTSHLFVVFRDQDERRPTTRPIALARELVQRRPR